MTHFNIKRRDLACDRRGYVQALQILACDGEIGLQLRGSLAQLLHLRPLQSLVGALSFLRDVFELALIGQFVAGVVVFAPANQAVGNEPIAALGDARQAPHLIIDVHQRASVRQTVLLKLQLQRVEIVELLGDFRFAGNHVELQLRVAQAHQRRTRLDRGAVFDKDLLDASTFHGIEKHRASGHDPSAQRNKILEHAFLDAGDFQARGANTQRTAAFGYQVMPYTCRAKTKRRDDQRRS